MIRCQNKEVRFVVLDTQKISQLSTCENLIRFFYKKNQSLRKAHIDILISS